MGALYLPRSDTNILTVLLYRRGGCTLRNAFRRDTSEHLLSRSDKTDELLMTLMTARDVCRRLIRRAGLSGESRGAFESTNGDEVFLGECHTQRENSWTL